MKPPFKIPLTKRLYLSILFVMAIFSCQKEVNQSSVESARAISTTAARDNGHLKQTKAYAADVVISWLNMQLDMLRVPLAPGTGSQAAERALAYCGIAVYEAVVPGMPAYQTLHGQLVALPAMPITETGKAYHWAASANAALAEMNRRLFTATAQANKDRINIVEDSLKAIYAGETDAATLIRSIAFGKEVATRVADWATTDGSANSNPAYVPPVSDGLWVPTALTPPVNPYAWQRRPLVPGVASGTALAPPPAYSTDPSSPFYLMVKDVYDKSLVLTQAQKDMAIYHRDAPGYPGGGHFVAILSQVLTTSGCALDKAALVYAKSGIASYDAITICFTQKYIVNLVRPVTYIQTVMGHPSWTTLIPTPNHPEFPSAHAVNGTAIATMLTNELGDHFEFTLHTYDYLGFPARSYHSFLEMSKEISDSRVFGGIHYQASCDKGRWLGEKVSQHILGTLQFLKD